jgi:hypothetical protein
LAYWPACAGITYPLGQLEDTSMKHEIDVRHQSTECIRTIYELVQQCLEADRHAHPGRKPFGIRDHPGWHDLTNSIEHELALRDENITMIVWDEPLFFSKND